MSKLTITKSVTVTDIILPPPPPPPPPPPAPTPLTGDFIFSPTNPKAGDTITFIATASGGTAPYTYSWFFGDSSAGVGSTITHVYTLASSFDVILVISDNAIIPPPPPPTGFPQRINSPRLSDRSRRVAISSQAAALKRMCR